MYEDIKSLLDVISSFLTILTICGFFFIILNGIVYKLGVLDAHYNEIRRMRNNKESVLSPIHQIIKNKPFWKDESLIYSGTITFGIVGFSLLYVMIFALWDILSEGTIYYDFLTCSMLLVIPIFILCSLIIVLSRYFKLQNSRKIIIFLNNIIMILTFIFLLLVTILAGSNQTSLIIDIISKPKIFLIMVFLLIYNMFIISYVIGIGETYKSANFKDELTPIKVNLVNSKTLEKLYYYKSTETDYHFITESGNECIIPINMVELITNESLSPKNPT